MPEILGSIFNPMSCTPSLVLKRLLATSAVSGSSENTLPKPAPDMPKESQSIGSRIFKGASSAMIAATPLAMGVTVFDRSVVQYANGSAKSLSSAVVRGFREVITKPFACLRSPDTMAVAAVYIPTYMTKNLTEAGCNHLDVNPFWPVFLISATINTGLGIMKDRYLATIFGSGVPNFPKISYALFAARDSFIVGASFNGPILMTPYIEERTGWSRNRSEMVAQLICPGLAQFVGTPLHLIGLDYYNRPDISFRARLDGLFWRTLEPLAVRICRQVYVFGLGGILVKQTNKLFGFYEPTTTRAGKVYNPEAVVGKMEVEKIDLVVSNATTAK